MNILITGGTGFIGSHLVNRLFKKNNIFVIKRKGSDTWRLKDVRENITFVNYESKKDLEIFFSKNSVDLIIHLATCYHKETDNISNLQQMDKTNVAFPSLLLSLAKKHKVKAFINTGTCFEYKLGSSPLSEKTVLEPYNYYASTKIKFEEVLKNDVSNNKVKGLTLKLFYPYGEKDAKKLIALLFEALKQNSPLEITKGQQLLNFTYVKDIADAFEKAIDFINSEKYSKYEVFNIGSRTPVKIKVIVKLIEEISRKKLKIAFTRPYDKNEIMYMNCDFSKAEKVLGWKPKTNIKQGLTKVYNYYLKEPNL